MRSCQHIHQQHTELTSKGLLQRLRFLHSVNCNFSPPTHSIRAQTTHRNGKKKTLKQLTWAIQPRLMAYDVSRHSYIFFFLELIIVKGKCSTKKFFAYHFGWRDFQHRCLGWWGGVIKLVAYCFCQCRRRSVIFIVFMLIKWVRLVNLLIILQTRWNSQQTLRKLRIYPIRSWKYEWCVSGAL